jgi:peptide/nickel transport system substrate-binding protein
MRFVRIVLLLTVLLGAAGCGGSGSSSDGSAPKVLRFGTLYYVDTFNPLVGIETNDTTAYEMIYPQLVQYGPGLKLVGDWASSWEHSADGLTWTFHLRPGKWSDGVPLTAADAAWTINLGIKYASGPTAYIAGTLDGVKSAEATDDHTLVVSLAHPVAPVLANFEQFFVLPKHIWEKQVGAKGDGLKAFLPQNHLPVVGGGPYYVSQFQQKGTTVFRPNPYFYGPKSRAKAVTLTFYTNDALLVSDLQSGVIDAVDALPYTAAGAIKNHSNLELEVDPGSEVTNLGFNSNPLKTKNRELLDPTVKEAFEYAIPRQQIVDVVFRGYAKPWANILSAWSGPSGWLNPDVQPLPLSPDNANQILDGLGYRRGSDGIRVVPATTGQYAQPAHRMSYGVVVPNDLDFNGDRQFQILQTGLQAIGVKLNEVAGGDGSQAYSIITAPDGKYLSADMYTWYWHPYIDPSFNLSVVTRAQWNNNSDTGFNDPRYDRWWKLQSRLVDPKQRRALVWKMEAYLAEKRPYIQLVDTDSLSVHSTRWTGFAPELWGYCKCFFTAPHPT